MSEVVNQWVGGLERLRWARDRAAAARRSPGGARRSFPRAASGEHRQLGGAWQALRALAVLMPATGARGRAPAWCRSRPTCAAAA